MIATIDATLALAVSWNLGIVDVIYHPVSCRALVLLLRGWEKVYRLGGWTHMVVVSAHFGVKANNIDRLAEFVFTL